MSGDLLADIGRALYGPYWHRELARALDVHERTVRRWEQGLFPAERWLPLVEPLVRDRGGHLDELLARIKQAKGATP